ncbi:hypothetical protein K438DRAFT_1762533 [Mycena galopus ATCC 62051]|nr:hypothetical protein K438DRAFT_1762533 [Mycena galopus ATCC 62051]
MPDYEVLHSGQYWQDVRRRAQDAKAARARRERGDSAFPSEGAQTVFTFAPGSPHPYTNLLQPNGKMVALSGPSKNTLREDGRAIRLATERKKQQRASLEARVKRAKQLQQRADDADAALLARLNGGKRKSDGMEQSTTKKMKRK